MRIHIPGSARVTHDSLGAIVEGAETWGDEVPTLHISGSPAVLRAVAAQLLAAADVPTLAER